MIVVVWPWYWPEGSHNGRGRKPYLLIHLDFRFIQDIMGITRPLWVGIIAVLHASYNIGIHDHKKGNNKHNQL